MGDIVKLQAKKYNTLDKIAMSSCYGKRAIKYTDDFNQGYNNMLAEIIKPTDRYPVILRAAANRACELAFEQRAENRRSCELGRSRMPQCPPV